MRKTIIFGTARFAEITKYYLDSHGGRVVAFTVDGDYLKDSTFCDRPVIAFEDIAEAYPPNDHDMVVAVGYGNLNSLRAERFVQAKALGYRLPGFVHPSNTIAGNVAIGANNLIFENNVILPFARIGDNVTVWCSNTIGHHVEIGDHAWITMNATVSGEARIGSRCFVGAGALFGPRIDVGERCIVGAGALLMDDAAAGGIYKAPATPRHRVTSDRFRAV